jgi:neuropeptide S receptor 1
VHSSLFHNSYSTRKPSFKVRQKRIHDSKLLLYFYLSIARHTKDRTQCWIELGDAWRWQLYMSLVAIVLFIIPALIISGCYAIIVKTIWEKGTCTYMAPSREKRKNLRNGANRDTDDEDDRGSRRASSRGIIPRAKVKTVKMTFVIVIVCK